MQILIIGANERLDFRQTVGGVRRRPVPGLVDTGIDPPHNRRCTGFQRLAGVGIASVDMHDQRGVQGAAGAAPLFAVAQRERGADLRQRIRHRGAQLPDDFQGHPGIGQRGDPRPQPRPDCLVPADPVPATNRLQPQLGQILVGGSIEALQLQRLLVIVDRQVVQGGRPAARLGILPTFDRPQRLALRQKIDGRVVRCLLGIFLRPEPEQLMHQPHLRLLQNLRHLPDLIDCQRFLRRK